MDVCVRGENGTGRGGLANTLGRCIQQSSAAELIQSALNRSLEGEAWS